MSLPEIESIKISQSYRHEFGVFLWHSVHFTPCTNKARDITRRTNDM